MSQLLTIETAFLRMPQVASALNLSDIRTLQRNVTNAQKKKFTQTLELSKLVVNAFNYFKSDACKQLMSEEGINWTNEQFGNKVFGWQKSYFYKVVKAGELSEEIITTFNAKCDEAEREGNEPNRSLDGLLKFSRAVENNESEGGQGEGEDSETDSAEVEIRTQTIFTLSWKTEGGNVAIRIDSEGGIHSNNTAEQVMEAIAFLQANLPDA
jgi:hypothetical protein